MMGQQWRLMVTVYSRHLKEEEIKTCMLKKSFEFEAWYLKCISTVWTFVRRLWSWWRARGVWALHISIARVYVLVVLCRRGRPGTKNREKHETPVGLRTAQVCKWIGDVVPHRFVVPCSLVLVFSATHLFSHSWSYYIFLHWLIWQSRREQVSSVDRVHVTRPTWNIVDFISISIYYIVRLTLYMAFKHLYINYYYLVKKLACI